MLKVFGVNLDGKYRGIVAAETQKKAAELLNMSLHHFRQYGSITEKKEEVGLAMSDPYIVWKQSYARDKSWIRVTKTQNVEGAITP